MLGHSGFTLLPSAPWHATQVADFACPASADPSAAARPDRQSTLTHRDRISVDRIVQDSGPHSTNWIRKTLA
jgi:hypothetical protein